MTRHLRGLPILARLRDTGDVTVALQGQLLILRWCVATAPNYWLRTMPPEVTAEATRLGHTDAIETLLAELLDFDKDSARGERALSQLRLPLSMGGFGFPAMEEIAPFAYTASIGGVWPNLAQFLGDLCPDLGAAAALAADQPALAHDDEALGRLVQPLQVVHTVIRASHDHHADLVRRYQAEDASPLGPPLDWSQLQPSRHFHPRGLPRQLPTVADFLVEDNSQRREAQRLLSLTHHHGMWMKLRDTLRGLQHDWDPICPEDTADPRREACRFVSASQFGAGKAWEAVPTCELYSVSSARLLIASQLRLGVPLSCLKGLTVLHTRGNVASVDPLGDVAVNSFGHHSRRHNTAMRRWEGFIRRTWRCQTRLDLRGYHQCLNSHKPKLADVELLGAHGGERSIFLEGKCLHPIKTKNGRACVAPLGDVAAFAATAPTISRDMLQRYAMLWVRIPASGIPRVGISPSEIPRRECVL